MGGDGQNDLLGCFGELEVNLNGWDDVYCCVFGFENQVSEGGAEPSVGVSRHGGDGFRVENGGADFEGVLEGGSDVF